MPTFAFAPLLLAAAAAISAATLASAASQAATPHRGAAAAASPAAPPKLDHSGRKRIGNASFYARHFFGRRMADGARMDPSGDNAASRTLPLGTVARVTNLETGRSAVVTIQDRGPYVAGRIVDLSPATAREIGLSHEQGVAQVEVAPIAVPHPDGRLRPGAVALEAQRRRE